MLMDHYIEVDGVPIKEPDNKKWAEWWSKADRKVKRTVIGDKAVSTVFLSFDHSYDPDVILLYETMIFDDDENAIMHNYCERYSTRKEALAGHKKICNYLRAVTGKK